MSSEAFVDQPVSVTSTADEVAAKLAKRPRIGERIIEGILFLAAVISILTTIGIVYVLIRDAIDFFLLPEVTLTEFFTSTTWQPQGGVFGIWPLLTSTLVVSAKPPASTATHTHTSATSDVGT